MVCFKVHMLHEHFTYLNNFMKCSSAKKNCEKEQFKLAAMKVRKIMVKFSINTSKYIKTKTIV